jgi:hypothetical protein
MAVEVTALGAALAPFASRTTRRAWFTAGAAGGVFVAALVAGVLVAPAVPSPFASRLRVHEYFVANHDAVLNQSLLVHGVAGAALAVLTVAVWRGFASGFLGRVFLGFGAAAAAVSFVQLFIVLRIENHIARGVGTRQTDQLFDALNRACALKLVLLAVTAAIAAKALLSADWPISAKVSHSNSA